jgi:hypothetical protein
MYIVNRKEETMLFSFLAETFANNNFSNATKSRQTGTI